MGLLLWLAVIGMIDVSVIVAYFVSTNCRTNKAIRAMQARPQATLKRMDERTQVLLERMDHRTQQTIACINQGAEERAVKQPRAKARCFRRSAIPCINKRGRLAIEEDKQ